MKEPLIIIEKEKVLGRCVELVGRERQYVSVIAVLFVSAYLCSMLFYLCYSTVHVIIIVDVTVVTLYGCHILAIFWN